MSQKILVVDDEQPIAEILKFNLEKEGYEVIIAMDGHEAIKLAEYEQPDLVLLDLMLPGLDGNEVYREIRKTQFMPIIMLTAQDIKTNSELNANDYVGKPFSTRDLLDRVKAKLKEKPII